jgi:iron(III) transport system substrate-binding protein
MRKRKLSRRDVLQGSLRASTALALGTVFASPARAQAPPPEAITPQLIEAAKKEGKVVWYTSIDLSVSEKIAASFKEKFGGIDVRVERTGAERVFQRIGQEYASNVHAVDIANSSDAAHLLAWKREGILLPYVPEDVAKHYKPEHRDPDGTYAGFRATLSPIAYNTKLVKAEDAPASFKDLLDPKWKGKILADDPRASGGGRVMFHMTYDKFGRAFQEKLATQELAFARDYQESVRRVARGEYPIYVPFILSEAANLRGLPVTYVVPREGVTYGSYASTILKNPPHPNAARLMADFYLSDEAQAVYARSGHGITIMDLAEKLPPEIEKLANAPPLVDEDFTRIDEMFAHAREIYK